MKTGSYTYGQAMAVKLLFLILVLAQHNLNVIIPLVCVASGTWDRLRTKDKII